MFVWKALQVLSQKMVKIFAIWLTFLRLKNLNSKLLFLFDCLSSFQQGGDHLLSLLLSELRNMVDTTHWGRYNNAVDADSKREKLHNILGKQFFEASSLNILLSY